MTKDLSAWRQPALEMVTLSHLFAKKGRAAVASAARHPAKPVAPALAAYLLGRTFNRLEKHLEAVRPSSDGVQTVWADYEGTRDHYKDADLTAKHAFVLQALNESPGQTVLDLGCNAGEFSLLAAAQSKQVVAADFDDGALTALYEKLRIQPANVSPVLLDVGRPTPAIGWMNREVPSFLDRAKGRFDGVMALGLMHHLLVSERVPLQLILELMLALEPKALIIEWVEPGDSRFVELVGLNAADQKTVSAEEFEAVFGKHYQLVRKQRLPDCNTRVLYYWLQKQSA
jgi:SAM-dependent methyltransferase